MNLRQIRSQRIDDDISSITSLDSSLLLSGGRDPIVGGRDRFSASLRRIAADMGDEMWKVVIPDSKPFEFHSAGSTLVGAVRPTNFPRAFCGIDFRRIDDGSLILAVPLEVMLSLKYLDGVFSSLSLLAGNATLTLFDEASPETFKSHSLADIGDHTFESCLPVDGTRVLLAAKTEAGRGVLLCWNHKRHTVEWQRASVDNCIATSCGTYYTHGPQSRVVEVFSPTTGAIERIVRLPDEAYSEPIVCDGYVIWGSEERKVKTKGFADKKAVVVDRFDTVSPRAFTFSLHDRSGILSVVCVKDYRAAESELRTYRTT